MKGIELSCKLWCKVAKSCVGYGSHAVGRLTLPFKETSIKRTPVVDRVVPTGHRQEQIIKT